MLLKDGLPQEILALGAKRIFHKNEHIYTVGSNIKSCFFIVSGSAKIYVDHQNGRRSILDFVEANDWLGELSLFCEEVDVKENTVLDEIICYGFDIEELRTLCLSNAQVCSYFTSYISAKLLKRSYRMSENLNFSLDIRLAAFMLQYQKNGYYRIAHTNASEYLNVSYRHVLHVVKHFCEMGILQKEKNKGYRILKLDALKKMIEF